MGLSSEQKKNVYVSGEEQKDRTLQEFNGTVRCSVHVDPTIDHAPIRVGLLQCNASVASYTKTVDLNLSLAGIKPKNLNLH